jgi:hypothetical protein
MVEADFARQERLVRERWPELAHSLDLAQQSPLVLEEVRARVVSFRATGIQLASAYDARAEAALQAESLPRESTLTLYGLGLGELPRQLLERPELKKLRVVLLNRWLLLTLLSRVDMSDWLSDPRVELALGAECPAVQSPFFALPAELALAEDAAWKIRDRLSSRIQSSFVNQRFSAKNEELVLRIRANQSFVDEDRDVSELFGTAPGREAWVLGAGPTLLESVPKLERLQKSATSEGRPLVIAVDTALRALAHAELELDCVVAIDPYLKAEYFAGIELERLRLVYFPLVPNEVLRSFRAQRYVALSASPLYDSVRGRAAELWAGGSVIHPALDLAIKMGATRIIFAGVDFAFVGGRTHAGWQNAELGKDLVHAQHWVRNERGEKVPSSPNFAGYLCALEDYIQARPNVQFFNSSDRGAHIAGAPFLRELF